MRLSMQTLRSVWAVIGFSVVIVLTVWGMRTLEEHVSRPRPDVLCDVVFTNVPQWLTTLAFSDGELVLETIKRQAGVDARDDLHDPSLCERVGTRLAASPWVAKVERVVKLPDGQIQVQAEFREPAAYVAVNGWAYLVDKAGVWLPHECSADFIRPGEWFLISGASEPIPKEPGEQWAGADLAAGLKLVEFLRAASARGEVPFRSSVRAIDVANYDLHRNRFDGRLRLRTVHPRCYVRWGEPPGEEYPVEPSASRKLDMLRTLYLERGELPDGKIVDLRKEDGIELVEFPGT